MNPMPDKLTTLLQFYEVLYARKITLESPTLPESDLVIYWETCYNKLWSVALAIQKESYSSGLFEFSSLRKYYPMLDNLLNYLQ